MTAYTRHDDGRLLTSEAVTEGHPDKICDEIADAIMSAVLRVNPHAHTGIEVAASYDKLLIFGEIGGITTQPDVVGIARSVLRDIGYTGASGLDPDTIPIENHIAPQSVEIDGGVTRAGDGDDLDSVGAGDQGMMIGYATDETPERLPLPFVLAHRLSAALEDARHHDILPWLRPDGKTQVTIRYDGNGAHVDTVLVSTQHDGTVGLPDVISGITDMVISPVLRESGIDHDGVRLLVNPCGEWHIGGPVSDSGLTGRKLGVDKYGGLALDGGGALCGKDPSKVDRSGAYAARWIARAIVDAGLAHRASVQIAYAISIPEPVSINVDTGGTVIAGLTDEAIADAVVRVFDLRPAAITRDLDLTNPDVYTGIKARGHFGRDGFTWERDDDKVRELKHALGVS